jgi:hypothetical protein
VGSSVGSSDSENELFGNAAELWGSYTNTSNVSGEDSVIKCSLKSLIS